MTANASYQRIREQLINLSVDLEDKSKLCEILVQKTNNERKALGLVEANCEEKYLAIIEVMLYLALILQLGAIMQPITHLLSLKIFKVFQFF